MIVKYHLKAVLMERILIYILIACFVSLSACAPSSQISRDDIRVDSSYVAQIQAKDPENLTQEEIAYLRFAEEQRQTDEIEGVQSAVTALAAVFVLTLAASGVYAASAAANGSSQ